MLELLVVLADGSLHLLKVVQALLKCLEPARLCLELLVLAIFEFVLAAVLVLALPLAGLLSAGRSCASLAWSCPFWPSWVTLLADVARPRCQRQHSQAGPEGNYPDRVFCFFPNIPESLNGCLGTEE